MKILLFGSNGQVGWELQRALAPLGEVVALDADSPGPLCADFLKPEALAATVRAVAPGLIVNAAAHTAVDLAESEPEHARAINAVAPAVLAREAASLGAWLVHFSTDYVFDGSGELPQPEDTPTAPLNVHGLTKREAEWAIRASGCRHLILRTSWVHSARGENFVRAVLRQAAQSDHLSVVDDQFGAPTSAELLADAAVHALRAVCSQPALGGTYHVAAAGVTSRHGCACHAVEFARGLGQVIRVRPENIFPVASSARTTTARRPRNSRLDTRKFQAAFGLVLPPWQTGVECTLRNLLAQAGAGRASVA